MTHDSDNDPLHYLNLPATRLHVPLLFWPAVNYYNLNLKGRVSFCISMAFSLISSRVSYCRMVSPTSQKHPKEYSKLFFVLEPLHLMIAAEDPVHEANLVMLKLPDSNFQSAGSPESTFKGHIQIHSNNMTSKTFGEL